MSRHFGNPSGQASRGQTSPSATRGVHEYAPSDSILISHKPPFKRSEIAQALIEISLVLTVSLGSIALAATGYLLFIGF